MAPGSTESNTLGSRGFVRGHKKPIQEQILEIGALIEIQVKYVTS